MPVLSKAKAGGEFKRGEYGYFNNEQVERKKVYETDTCVIATRDCCTGETIPWHVFGATKLGIPGNAKKHDVIFSDAEASSTTTQTNDTVGFMVTSDVMHKFHIPWSGER